MFKQFCQEGEPHVLEALSPPQSTSATSPSQWVLQARFSMFGRWRNWILSLFFFLLFFLKTKNKNHDVHFCAGWGKAARTEKTLWATSVAGRLFSISSPRSTSPSGRTMTSAPRELTSSAESPASTGSGCRSEAKLVLCNEKKQFASKIAFLFLSRWLTQWTAVCSQQWEKSLTLWDPSCGTLSTRRSTCRAVTFTGRCWDQLTLQSEPCGVE